MESGSGIPGRIFPLRIALWAVLAILTGTLLVHRDEAGIVVLLHGLDLALHEFGHPLFSFLGNEVLTSLGGSLFQVLMPLVCFFVLWLKQRDRFGASVALWWAAESLLDVAPYVADAVPMQLELIGGGNGAQLGYGAHDWNFVLTELGLLHRSLAIARAMEFVALAGALFAVVWGGIWIVREMRFARELRGERR